MPEPTSEDMRVLFEEQGRLRAEVEHLRQEQQRLQGDLDKSGNKPGSDNQQDGQGQKEGNKQEKGQDQDQEQKGKDQKGGKDQKDGKDEQKQEKKPSLIQRSRGWVRAHPIASVLIVIGVIILLVAGYLLLQYLESYESTDDAQVDGHTDPISPRINGTVVGVYVENTYRVKKGQLLVDLDPRDYEVALRPVRQHICRCAVTDLRRLCRSAARRDRSYVQPLTA